MFPSTKFIMILLLLSISVSAEYNSMKYPIGVYLKYSTSFNLWLKGINKSFVCLWTFICVRQQFYALLHRALSFVYCEVAGC